MAPTGWLFLVELPPVAAGVGVEDVEDGAIEEVGTGKIMVGAAFAGTWTLFAQMFVPYWPITVASTH